MDNKTIENLKRLLGIDNLEKIKNTGVPNKPHIGSNRGVGISAAPLSRCQTIYTGTSGSYSFAGLVDNTSGPKIVDGVFNHCEQVNTITGMRETGTSSLTMTLKPDGVFFPSSGGYMYTNTTLIGLWNSSPETYPFDPVNKWAFPSAQEAYDFMQDALTIDNPSNVRIDHALTPEILTEGDIGDYNFSTTYPLYVAWQDGTEFAPDATYIWGIPINYNFTIDTDGSMLTPPIIEAPFIGTADSGTFETTFGGIQQYNPTEYSNIVSGFQLAIEVASTHLWKPNPDETTAPLKYTNGVSIVTFEFAPPGYTRKGVIRPAKDGGFMLYEVDSGNTPIGLVRVFKNDRTMSTAVPVAQMNVYLP